MAVAAADCGCRCGSHCSCLQLLLQPLLLLLKRTLLKAVTVILRPSLWTLLWLSLALMLRPLLWQTLQLMQPKLRPLLLLLLRPSLSRHCDCGRTCSCHYDRRRRKEQLRWWERDSYTTPVDLPSRSRQDGAG